MAIRIETLALGVGLIGLAASNFYIAITIGAGLMYVFLLPVSCFVAFAFGKLLASDIWGSVA